ncbi:hypothetical protein AIN02nite_29130 [Acetobacter indonesiensis]|uniref:Uncharacterized protein n=1 Tax=Acetobacter indonesiensis TaxID=104101 RepID=A0A6N3T9P9_9PROT|nr:hypothetical protein AIN02nite_29130 [Acetobacter indonesiensis]
MVAVVAPDLRFGRSPGGLLCCCADPLQEQYTAHIVDDISQSNPRGNSRYAYGPDEQSRL